ncbi:MAG: hypothetical protein PHQ27_04700 [Victivallales bacterium]|nr:hypothetical protein [Victivallales bacterium]
MQKLHEIVMEHLGHGVKVYFRGCSDAAAVGGVIVDADDELLKLEYCLQKKEGTRSVAVYIRFAEVRALKFQTPDRYDRNFQPIRN